MNVVRLIIYLRNQNPIYVTAYCTEEQARKTMEMWTMDSLKPYVAFFHTLGSCVVRTEDIMAMHTLALEMPNQLPPGTPR